MYKVKKEGSVFPAVIVALLRGLTVMIQSQDKFTLFFFTAVSAIKSMQCTYYRKIELGTERESALVSIQAFQRRIK